MKNQNQQRGERGFQKIGTCLPPVSSSPRTGDTTLSKSSALPTTSETTTAKSRKTPAKTGTPVGGSGFSVSLVSTDPLELAALNTGALMKALEASLPTQLKLQPEWKDGEAEWEMPLGYTVQGTAADKAMARALIERTMAPLPAREIAQELAKLNAVTIPRWRESANDRKLRVAAYLEKLGAYPGETVLWALQKWPETEDGDWWPSWKKLHEMLEYRVGERRLMLEALG